MLLSGQKSANMSRYFLPRVASAAAVALGAILTLPLAVAQQQSIIIAGVQWALTTNGSDIKWPDAERYCADLRLEGRGDWRLPTMTELESLRDRNRPGGIRAPFDVGTCCLWSSTTLEERDSPDSHEIAGSRDMYRWGYMFDADVAYYAVSVFDDGQALCVRDAGAGPAHQ
jgi:hypothetical protein